jgi:hypothetical protein
MIRSRADNLEMDIIQNMAGISNHRCPNSCWGSHKFEARYDLSPADMSAFANFKARDPSYMEPLRAKTYVRDICTKCGKTIERVKA